MSVQRIMLDERNGDKTLKFLLSCELWTETNGLILGIQGSEMTGRLALACVEGGDIVHKQFYDQYPCSPRVMSKHQGLSSILSSHMSDPHMIPLAP